MPAIPFPWILADADAVVGVVFMLMVFIGWVVNFFNQKKPPVPPNRRNGPPRPVQDPKTVQSEIEKFLSQARQNTPGEGTRDNRSRPGQPEPRPQSPAQSMRRAPPTEQRPRSRKEVWNEQVGNTSGSSSPARQQPSSSRKPASGGQQPRQASMPTSARRAEAGKASRPVPAQESRLPQNIQENRLEKVIAQDLAPQIGSSVSAHLGTFTATSPQSLGEQSRSETLSVRETPAAGLAKLMKSRRSVRNAILLSEIMAKPRALRR